MTQQPTADVSLPTVAGTAVDSAPDWAAVRDRFPVTRRVAYLNSGFQGPMSDAVAGAMRARSDLEVEYGATSRRAMDDKADSSNRLREAAARLLGADPDEVALTGNTTEGVNIAVNGIRIEPGDGVVSTTAEHGGGIVPAYYLRERRGADLRLVPVAADDPDEAILERFERALDARARLVILSHISFSNGRLLPLEGIAALARDRGASVVVDGAQTAGHLPLDVHALGVDAYAIPVQKWLCGPSGLGALYVRRDRIPHIEPDRVSGRAAAAFDYEGSFAPERERARKYELGTVSAPAIAGAAAAVEQYLDWGPGAAWDRARALNRHAEAALADVDGVTIVSPHDDAARTGLFAFSLAGRDPQLVAAWLQSAGDVVCRSVRHMDAVRLSLHVYNTEAEVERVAELVTRLAAGEVPEAELEAARPPAAAEA
jgi:L-cysteine/cystine lyase